MRTAVMAPPQQVADMDLLRVLAGGSARAGKPCYGACLPKHALRLLMRLWICLS